MKQTIGKAQNKESGGGAFLRNVGNHLQENTRYNPEDQDIRFHRREPQFSY
jgi:hypothetical protein